MRGLAAEGGVLCGLGCPSWCGVLCYMSSLGAGVAGALQLQPAGLTSEGLGVSSPHAIACLCFQGQRESARVFLAETARSYLD